MKFFSKCESCRKRRFIIRVRKVWIAAINQYASSKRLICGRCVRSVQKAIQ